VISREEFEGLKKKVSGLTKVALEVLYLTGARVSEVIGLKRTDITRKEYKGHLFLLFNLRTLKKKRKTYRIIPAFRDEFSRSVIEYLNGRRGYIFESPYKKGVPITRQAIFSNAKEDRIIPALT